MCCIVPLCDIHTRRGKVTFRGLGIRDEYDLVTSRLLGSLMEPFVQGQLQAWTRFCNRSTQNTASTTASVLADEEARSAFNAFLTRMQTLFHQSQHECSSRDNK